MTKSLKNVKNEKCSLKDLEYGEKTEKSAKMRYTHFMTAGAESPVRAAAVQTKEAIARIRKTIGAAKALHRCVRRLRHLRKKI